MERTDIICIASHKGGVGKTTSTATLGSILAASGESVLLVQRTSLWSLKQDYGTCG